MKVIIINGIMSQKCFFFNFLFSIISIRLGKESEHENRISVIMFNIVRSKRETIVLVIKLIIKSRTTCQEYVRGIKIGTSIIYELNQTVTARRADVQMYSCMQFK